jgi:hypothetical protein
MMLCALHQPPEIARSANRHAKVLDHAKLSVARDCASIMLPSAE